MSDQYGRLTIVGEISKRAPRGHVLVEYLCACGNRKTARLSDIRRGKVQSCGCLRIEVNRTAPHALGKHWKCKPIAAPKLFIPAATPKERQYGDE